MDTRYLSVFIAFFGVPLAAIVALNLALGERALGSAEAVRQASAWQQATHGITYAPPVTNSRPFKSLRLADRVGNASEINTVVLGASSLMGMTENLFPAPTRIYNFALTANLTPTVTAEAIAIAQTHANVRTFVIGLDWAIPALYQSSAVPMLDLRPAAQLAGYASQSVPVHQRLTDSVSLPKVKILWQVLRDGARAPNPTHALRAWRDVFTELAGAPYTCADGKPARDFDIVSRGTCLGFRPDGSWTFANEQHLTPARAQVLARAAAAPSSQFAKYLCTTQGEPNTAVLNRLGEFARGVIRTEGQVVFVIPPLVPGMAIEMQQGAVTAQCYARTYTALDAWAHAHGVTVIDAAPSERYGCQASEFLDENHAWPECHARVLSHYWQLRERGAAVPGVYRP